MKLSLLSTHYSPREKPSAWPVGETRTLSQLVAYLCPEKAAHAPQTTNTRCAGCGLYFGEA